MTRTGTDARLWQVEESKANLQMAEGSNEYNIWYGRYLGEQWKESKELIAAEHRFAPFYPPLFAQSECTISLVLQPSSCTSD